MRIETVKVNNKTDSLPVLIGVEQQCVFAALVVYKRESDFENFLWRGNEQAALEHSKRLIGFQRIGGNARCNIDPKR
ncbi:MAG TPA: hypothetical protein DDX57_03055 [Bacteroidales bacterium]|nr:MAG: hypothetical protein A2W94_00065 [Bacteroidetes bacterium GWE2_42_42]HBG69748.1 hypothetical protein [Bacteroidales bacterium]HCB61124.1 hypothetical protein [Bacteroidales bacterium]